jgi:hypothetical protein
MTGVWRKLRKEELRDLYTSLTVTGIMKSKRMKWVGHVARMGKNNIGREARGKDTTKMTKTKVGG